MIPAKLLARRHRKFLADPTNRHGLLPAPWFHHSLRRERARSDRTGSEFVLLIFTPRDRATAKKTNLRVARELKRHLTDDDEAGWFDDERIAVILAETPAENAWRLADAVCLAFPLSAEPPLCDVFVYPSAGEMDFDGQDLLAQNLAERRPARRLEDVFVQPLPFWKRLLDVLGASFGLVLCAPVMAVLAVLIKLESPGPVFFRQWRTGQGGRPFVMYKFRSMTADAEQRRAALATLNEQDGPAFKIRFDPRVTRLGRGLRSTSLDELPQLWNVLWGDMSLVGPRPLPCDESDACARWQRRRLDVRPGLTCIWQVRGRSRVSFDEWMRMDLQYVASHSIGQDLKLLAATAWAVLRRTGT
ncbi:MAG TPA: sugar transferase [Pirellulales bacterium]|nr:sugar transferase [Pirellulales bacterium]